MEVAAGLIDRGARLTAAAGGRATTRTTDSKLEAWRFECRGQRAGAPSRAGSTAATENDAGGERIARSSGRSPVGDIPPVPLLSARCAPVRTIHVRCS